MLSDPTDDHTRVRLQLLDGDPHSDYINANYIDVSVYTTTLKHTHMHTYTSDDPNSESCVGNPLMYLQLHHMPAVAFAPVGSSLYHLVET